MVYAESCIQAIFKGFGDLPILICLSVCDQVFGVFLLSPWLKQAHTLPTECLQVILRAVTLNQVSRSGLWLWSWQNYLKNHHLDHSFSPLDLIWLILHPQKAFHWCNVSLNDVSKSRSYQTIIFGKHMYSLLSPSRTYD